MAHRLTLRRARGFSLIELLVAVVIVGLLSAVAYPSYVESVRKGKRASAKAKMVEVAGRLGQFYSDAANNMSTYTVLLTDLSYPAGALYSEAKGHTVAVTAGTGGIASTYIIKATPVTTDPVCGELTLDNLGTFLPPNC